MTPEFGRLAEALKARYEIERPLGEGGMAFVFLARDLKHDRAVAVKLLKPELAASIGGERFLREIRVAAQLQHPNILTLYDSGDAGGLLYYVMPFVQGESLRDRLTRERQLPIEDAMRIIREAAEALQYAHDRGIVHRDIKPENILLQGGHALVADFGIAKALHASAGSKLTETGTAVGTPHYMSPEQALGGEVDGRSDQYSLGCVLYEALVGQSPFDGPNAMAVIARHAMEQVPSIQVVRSTVPDELEDAVYRTLEKTAADRYPDMRGLIDALGDVEAVLTLERSAQRRGSTPRTPMPAAMSTARTPRTPQRVTAAGAGAARTAETLPLAVTDGGAVRWRRLALGLGGAIVLGAGALAAWQLRPRPRIVAPAADAASDPRRVAVLYFRDRSGDGALAGLADGLTEDLIRSLSTVQELQVVSQNGVGAFRGTTLPRDSVGRALRVGTLVEGDVEPGSPGTVRVTTRPLEARGGSEFDRASAEFQAGDPLAMRDSITRQVADFLRRRLGSELRVREQRSAARSAEAWSMVRGAEQWMRRADSVAATGDSATAGRYFAAADSVARIAEGLDRDWTDPTLLRAEAAYRLSRLAVAAPFAAAPLIDSGLAFAGRVLARDAADANALELRGNLRYWRYLLRLEGDSRKAEALLESARKDLEESVRINPRQAGAHASLSHLYYETSSQTDVLLAAQKAYESDAWLEDAGTVLDRLFSASYDLDDAVQADRWCKEGAHRFPTDARFQLCQLYLLTMRAARPDVSRAWQLASSETIRSDPNTGSPEFTVREARMLVAAVLARAGLGDSARAVIASARAGTDIDPTRELSQTEAFVHLLLGDRAAALSALKQFLVANPEYREGLAEDPGWWFRDLAQDPGFRTATGAP